MNGAMRRTVLLSALSLLVAATPATAEREHHGLSKRTAARAIYRADKHFFSGEHVGRPQVHRCRRLAPNAVNCRVKILHGRCHWRETATLTDRGIRIRNASPGICD